MLATDDFLKWGFDEVLITKFYKNMLKWI
jgi:hypothetical protein